MRKAMRKAYEITDAKIQFVSLVDKAANLRKFLITRAKDGEAAFTTCGRIIKTDAENHYVTGIVYEPMTEDSHGNYMTEEEIVKACYWYSENGDKVDLQHSFEPLDGASVVENWVAKADFTVGDEEVKKGTWLMTVKVKNDDVWQGIEKGEITGLSMGGVGNYSEEDVELEKANKEAGTETGGSRKGLLKQLANALGINVVEKGDMAELYEERQKGNAFWNAFSSLEDTLRRYDGYRDKYVYEEDEEKIRECLTDFENIITSILTGGQPLAKAIVPDESEPVRKAGKKMSSKNRETLQGIYDSLGTFLKEFDDPEPDDKDDTDKPDDDEKDKEEKQVTKQEVESIVAEAITKAMGDQNPQTEPQQNAPAQAGTEGVVKDAEGQQAASAEITAESIEKMVQEAVRKAMEPQQETVTAEQVQSMITEAVAKAVDPVLKSKGLPSNLGGSVEKGAGSEVHYLHGIL